MSAPLPPDAHLPDDVLQRFVDEALPAEESQAAQAHLAACPDCALLAQDYRDLFGKLARLPDPPPPPRFTQAVMARVEAHRQEVARQRLVAGATFATSLAAALLCFVGAGNHIWAHEMSSWSAQLIEAGHLAHVAVDVLGSLFSALRLPLILAASALSVPLLLVLYRSLPERPLSAST